MLTIFLSKCPLSLCPGSVRLRLGRKISWLDTVEIDVETIGYFVKMSLILVSRELKTDAEGLRRKVTRLDTLEREMLKQYFVKMSLILCVSRELKTEAEG